MVATVAAMAGNREVESAIAVRISHQAGQSTWKVIATVDDCLLSVEGLAPLAWERSDPGLPYVRPVALAGQIRPLSTVASLTYNPQATFRSDSGSTQVHARWTLLWSDVMVVLGDAEDLTDAQAAAAGAIIERARQLMGK